jgi:hypothetical protein
MKHLLVGILLALVGLTSTFVTAQTVANGPYYATPSWDQTLPVAQRFIVLANMNQQAVLDRETGLVWERGPSLFNAEWISAVRIYVENNRWSPGLAATNSSGTSQPN